MNLDMFNGKIVLSGKFWIVKQSWKFILNLSSKLNFRGLYKSFNSEFKIKFIECMFDQTDLISGPYTSTFLSISNSCLI